MLTYINLLFLDVFIFVKRLIDALSSLFPSTSHFPNSNIPPHCYALQAVCINKELIEKGFARQMELNEKPTVPAPPKGPDYSSTRASISTANISVDPRRDTQHSPLRTNNSSVNSSPDPHRNRSPHRADCRLKTVGAREPTPEKNLVEIGGTKSKFNTFSL